ncbi:L-dopachrome tautomerase yellow-f-like [Bombyx mandarina]|uniref:L-dopachrome tautomerase yellow-f-like n=1 Tax=Bombyx mandarina TaxID=7092 RepID=A0A6J2JBJ1_BOMMA|nr:L-dopachrome tautomerase yellow-f-like [Bombyx mandarina]
MQFSFRIFVVFVGYALCEINFNEDNSVEYDSSVEYNQNIDYDSEYNLTGFNFTGFNFTGFNFTVNPDYNFIEGNVELEYAWTNCHFDIGGVTYYDSSDVAFKEGSIHFVEEELTEEEKFYIKNNNRPFAIDGGYTELGYFITIPRTEPGIPSTVNVIDESEVFISPDFKPFDNKQGNKLVSVYKTFYDFCRRLWMVDTGLIDIPGAQKQVKHPSLAAYREGTDHLIFSFDISPAVLINGTATEGLMILGVDTGRSECNDTFVYITDQATDGIIVFSLEDTAFTRLNVTDLNHFPTDSHHFEFPRVPINFIKYTLTSNLTTGRERLKSFTDIMMSTRGSEAANLWESELEDLDIDLLEKRKFLFSLSVNNHNLVFVNKARDGVLCWNLAAEMKTENVYEVAKLNFTSSLYISDVLVVGNTLKILLNRKLNSSQYQDPDEWNHYMYTMDFDSAIEDTACFLNKDYFNLYRRYFT